MYSAQAYDLCLLTGVGLVVAEFFFVKLSWDMTPGRFVWYALSTSLQKCNALASGILSGRSFLEWHFVRGCFRLWHFVPWHYVGDSLATRTSIDYRLMLISSIGSIDYRPQYKTTQQAWLINNRAVSGLSDQCLHRKKNGQGDWPPAYSGASIPMGQGGHVPPNIWTGGDMITNVSPPPIFLE